MTGSYIAKIGGIVTGVVAAVGFMWQTGPVITDLQTIYRSKDAILHATELVDEIHEMQRDVAYLERKIDSLQKVEALIMHGKFPYDSAYVLTSSGWRILPKDTKWIYKREY